MKPEEEGSMFFTGMAFNPTEQLKQSDLNKIVVHLFRRVFRTEGGELFPVKHPDNPTLSLIAFIQELDMRLDEEAFAELPDEIKKFFMVIHRDGTKYQYGSRPR